MLDPIERDKPTGIDIELRMFQPGLARSSVDLLAKDPSITFATASLDSLLRSGNRSRLSVVAAPWERDDAGIIWDDTTYPEISSIADFATYKTLKVQAEATDPSLSYFANSGLINRNNFTRVEAAARMARMLDEPAKLSADPSRNSWQFLDEAGWSNYPHAVVTTQTLLTSRNDCMRTLIPKLQQSLGVIVCDPPRFAANLAAVGARVSQSIDQGIVAQKVTSALNLGIIGNGSNRVIGDVQRERIAQMARALTIGRNAKVNEKDIASISRSLSETRTSSEFGLKSSCSA
jgi:hypothetical protein